MVRSGVSVIEEKGGWSCSVIANSGIVQLFFERKVSYEKIAKVLAAEGLKVPKKTIWITISKYKAHGTLSHLPGSGRRFKLTRSFPFGSWRVTPGTPCRRIWPIHCLRISLTIALFMVSSSVFTD